MIFQGYWRQIGASDQPRITPGQTTRNSLLFVLPWVFASVAIGMAIGFYLGVARGAQSQTDAVGQERERTLKVLSGLVTATEQLTSDVNVRNTEIRNIGQNIGKLDLVGELPEIQHALMTQVTRVLESNLKLEDYLADTQCQVEEQAQ